MTLNMYQRWEKYLKGMFPVFVNTITYEIIKISIITILKLSDIDRHQLTVMTNPLSVHSNHPGRSMRSVRHRIWASIIISHKLETHSKTVVALDDHEMQVECIYTYIIVLSIGISFNLLIYSIFCFRQSMKQLHIQGTNGRSHIMPTLRKLHIIIQSKWKSISYSYVEILYTLLSKINF